MVTSSVVERQPAAELRGSVRCSYVARFDGADHSLFPDGCVDLVWGGTGVLRACGPETTGWSFQLPDGATSVGVRLEPGIFPALLGIPADRITDRQVDADELLPPQLARSICARIGEAASPERQRAVLYDAVRSMVRARRESDIGSAVARALAAAPPSTDLAAVARDLGLSRRQLHRVSVNAVGYGPSMFRRVLRIQRALHVMRRRPVSLGGVAALAGFADQAHMTREFQSICRMTPGRARLRRSDGGTGIDATSG